MGLLPKDSLELRPAWDVTQVCVVLCGEAQSSQGHFQLTFVFRAHPPGLLYQFCDVCICQS